VRWRHSSRERTLSTHFRPPVRRLRVEAFRGFRDPREFDLSASTVVVTGPNGTGKTSFFDALQWGLLGTIDRLEAFRPRRNVEHLVNQYRLGERAQVELDLDVRGRVATIRRSGTYQGSTLEFREIGAPTRFGNDAEQALEDLLSPSEGVSLEVALKTSGLMQQDVMRSVLEAKSSERYRTLSLFLGLGELEAFEDATKKLAQDAQSRLDAAVQERDRARTALKVAQDRLSESQQRLELAPRAEPLREELLGFVQGAPEPLRVTLGEELGTAEGRRALIRGLQIQIDLIERLTSTWSDPAIRQAHAAIEPPVEASRNELAIADSRLAKARSELEQSRAELAIAERAADDALHLAALAIPLLTDACPVCGQRIDAAHVAEALRARADDVGAVSELRKQVEGNRRDLADRERERADLARVLRDQEATKAVITRNLEIRDQIEREVRRLTSPSAFLSFEGDPARFLDNLPGVFEFLRLFKRRLVEYVSAADNGPDRGEVERAASEVDQIAGVLKDLEGRVHSAAQRFKDLKGLADASVEARVEVTQRRFNSVKPLVENIYRRLDPHPSFKSLDFELDTYYRRGATSPRVTDPVTGVSADPLLVFSTSQANIAALSYFLAIGQASGDTRLPFLLLDDPVQSMDDVNVLGFADLCRHLRRERQLVISTHERRFSNLLERKLAPRSEGESAIVIQFTGWDRSGPSVEQKNVAHQMLDRPLRVLNRAS
jgi:DNA repair exonuclease SbcCD ATPase subunit